MCCDPQTVVEQIMSQTQRTILHRIPHIKFCPPYHYICIPKLMNAADNRNIALIKQHFFNSSDVQQKRFFIHPLPLKVHKFSAI